MKKGYVLFLLIFGSLGVWGQVVWSGAAACVPGGNTAWLTPSNWCGGVLPGSGQIARFGADGTATLLDIDMNAISVANKTMGAIEIENANTVVRTIQNSSTTVAGAIVLNGATVNSVPNVILRNNSSTLLSISNNANPTGVFGISLGNTTENIINIDGTGGITINVVIKDSTLGAKKLTKGGVGSGVLTLVGANTYTGGTTITAGTLTCGAINTIPATGQVTFNGGTLRTGATSGFTQSTGTLNLTENSNIILGTVVHSLSFANSNAVSWTAGKTLTITGWTGGYNGTTGTEGKIFVGSDATGLTPAQLSQIIFFNGVINFSAKILSSGEVVPFITTATDYFRSVASGSWVNLATWQSSSDSSYWIPATLVPDATAAHVVIHSPDSVWLDMARTTANLTVLSGAKVNALAFSVTATSRFNLLGTASFYQGGTSTPVPGVGVQQVLAATSNYYFNGTQAGTTPGAYPAFGNLFWQPAPTTGGTFENSATIAPANLGLYVQGNMTINLQSAAQQEIMFATGTSVTRSHVILGNLNILSANSKVVVTNGGLPVRGTLTVGGNINISAGILQGTSTTPATDGSASLNLLGNINNTGGTIQTGLSTAGKFSLNYVGTAAQSINNTGGTFTFTANQLDTVNNTNATGITLNTPLTHSGTIRFISGVVNTSTANLLTMGAGSAVAAASNASFVNGPVSKIGNTDFTFPVGKPNCGPSATVNGYAALKISTFTNGNPADQFTAEYKRGSAYALGAISNAFIHHISRCDYWTLTRDGATVSTVDITLSWDDPINNCVTNAPYINRLNSLAVAHNNNISGSTWDTYSVANVTSGNTVTGTVTWDIGSPQSTTFGAFVIASLDLFNPLPITINYFNGTRNNGNHLLNWKVTCISTPSATIELERSIDGRTYNSIYSIFATALRCQQPFDYTDNNPAKGVNYYRLKMTDVDGKITYSSILSLINASKGIEVMNIAPNPIVNGAFNLKISTAEKTQMELVVIDMQGRVMMKQLANTIAGFNVIPVNVRQLTAGTYQLFGNTADGKTRVLRFVVQ